MVSIVQDRASTVTTSDISKDTLPSQDRFRDLIDSERAASRGGSYTVASIRIELKDGLVKEQIPLRSFEVKNETVQEVPWEKLREKTTMEPSKDGIELKSSPTQEQTQAAIEQGKGRGVAGRAAPEDLSTNPKEYLMGHQNGDYAFQFLPQLDFIGRVEGFQVTVLTSDEADRSEITNAIDAKVRPNTSVHVVPGGLDVWTEDSMVMTSKGEVVVPNSPSAALGSETALGEIISREQVKRWYNVALDPNLSGAALNQELSKYPLVSDIGGQGVVDKRGNRESKASFALAAGLPVSQAQSYVEGGNLLVGKLANGETYGIIGADSVVISKAIFEKQEGRSLTEKDAVERIAKDYGIDPSRMTVVEQPGQFHIDMAISPVTNGKLLVNDARAAFALQERLIKEDYEKAKPTDPAKVQAWEEKGKQITKALDELKEKTERRALLEDKAVSQLEAAGLSVVRVPGVMDRVDPARSISAAAAAGNFLNSEKGTNAKGEQFVVFLGGDPRVEQRVAETVGKSFPEVERIYFLDRSASEKSVGMKGGVSCRVNVIPE